MQNALTNLNFKESIKTIKNNYNSTTVLFETPNTKCAIDSFSSKDNDSKKNFIGTFINFNISDEFKNNASIAIYDKDNNIIATQDDIGSIVVVGNTDYLDKIYPVSIINSYAEAYKLASDNLRTVMSIESNAFENCFDKITNN